MRLLLRSICSALCIPMVWVASSWALPADDSTHAEMVAADGPRESTPPAEITLLSSAPPSSKKLAPGVHPLHPVMELARHSLHRIQTEVRDYTCVMDKQERVNGRLRVREQIFAKVRHEQVEDGKVVKPLAVYMKFLSPKQVAGREVLYIEGRNDGKLLVRKGGPRLASLTVNVDPESIFAMSGNRYPITEFGVLRMIERLIDIGDRECQFGECQVSLNPQASIENTDCTCIEIEHPQQRDHFQFHLARIYLNNESGIPVRFECYDWPEAGSSKPVIKEEYRYRRLKINVGLDDKDFDPANPGYRFQVQSKAENPNP